MRFLVDAQLPPLLARALTGAGHQAQHVADLGLRHATDQELWSFAGREQAIIMTKDEDFVDRYRRQIGGPAVVWLRLGNATNRMLLAWLLPVLPKIVARLEAGDHLVEVR